MVHTTHPGNIGAVARAMKNMCLHQLVLVNPKVFPSNEATVRASGAVDVLEDARVVGSLEEAVSDCHVVIGASARSRSTVWSPLDPKEAADLAYSESAGGQVALVFGRESSGLTNEELDRCSHLIHIPSNPDYSSLNVAMAVQVLSYELRMLQLARDAEAAVEPAREVADPPASVEQMEGLFTHLQEALNDVGFLQEGREGKIMQRLRRLFYRAEPDVREVNILRGILSAAQGGKTMRSSK